MNKKQILIFSIAGLVSLSCGFGITFFVRLSNQIPAGELVKGANSFDESGQFSGSKGSTRSALTGDAMARTLSEKQLKALIYDIREKITEYKYREKDLEVQEKRLADAKGSLQEDIEKLTTLRTELSSTLSLLRQQEINLQHTIVEVSNLEKSNALRNAQRYDKMKPKSASEIMTNMASNNQINDAVLILYYMQDRTAAKLLSEMKPELAAIIFDKLKRIKESE